MEGYRGDEKENCHMVQELGESRMGRREKNGRGNNKRIGNWLSGRMNAPRVAANLAVFEHRREPEEREREILQKCRARRSHLLFPLESRV